MNKRFLLALSFIVLLAGFGATQSVDTVMDGLITDLTLSFRADNPDLVFKPNLAVIPIVDNSPNAKEYEVGPALTAIIESKMQRSLIFNIVNDQLREKLIEEIKFSLSGLAEGGPEPGQLASIDVFLSGQVTELGPDFRVNLRLIQAESGKVLYTVVGEIPTSEVFQTSEAFTAAYVSPYGLGIEFSGLLWMHIYGQMSDIEGQPVKGDTSIAHMALNYRIRRWLVAWGGLELSPGAVRFDNSSGNEATLTETDFANIVGLPAGSFYGYEKERSPFFSLFLGAGYVLNVTKVFNVTLGTEVSMTQTFIVQKYTIPSQSDLTTVTHTITSNDMALWSVTPKARLQYFVTPRVAINFDYGFKYQFAEKSPGIYYFQDGSYSEFTPIYELFDLDPSIDPEGRSHYTDLTGHKISIGMGFFF